MHGRMVKNEALGDDYYFYPDKASPVIVQHLFRLVAPWDDGFWRREIVLFGKGNVKDVARP